MWCAAQATTWITQVCLGGLAGMHTPFRDISGFPTSSQECSVHLACATEPSHSMIWHGLGSNFGESGLFLFLFDFLGSLFLNPHHDDQQLSLRICIDLTFPISSSSFSFFLFCFQLLNIVNHWCPKKKPSVHSFTLLLHSFVQFSLLLLLTTLFLTVFYFASIIQPFITPLATPYAKNPPAHPQTEAGQTKRRSPPICLLL